MRGDGIRTGTDAAIAARNNSTMNGNKFRMKSVRMSEKCCYHFIPKTAFFASS